MVAEKNRDDGVSLVSFFPLVEFEYHFVGPNHTQFLACDIFYVVGVVLQTVHDVVHLGILPCEPGIVSDQRPVCILEPFEFDPTVIPEYHHQQQNEHGGKYKAQYNRTLFGHLG
jgi:hypothetical protein